MGIKLVTDDKGVVVYRKEKVSKAGNPYSTFSIKASTKDDNGGWVSAWYELKFPKSAELPNDKAKIVINNSFPIVEEYNGNVQTRYMVMDFKVIEQGETPSNANAPSMDSFMNINDDDFLPFARPTR